MACIFRRFSKVFTLLLLLGATACARLDSGAPVEWGSGFRPYGGQVSQAKSTKIPSPYQVEVQPGENLYRIAKRNNMPVNDLIEANEIKPPYAVQPGQKLVVADAKVERRVHVVQHGDTLYSLSKRYDTKVEELASLNGVGYPYALKPGQRLAVSGTGSVRTAQHKSKATNLYVGRTIPVAPPIQTKVVSAPKVITTTALVPMHKPQREINLWQKLRGDAKPLPSTVGSNGFVWPVQGKILSSYGSKQNGLHNDGINIAVARGTKVHAAKGGVVTYAGNELRGYGNLVLIKHADGFVTAYAHNDKILVRRGDQVRQGEVIAKAGTTGAVTSPQVHFEIRKGRDAVNPKGHLKGV